VAQSNFTFLLIFRQSAVACYKFGVAPKGICGESLATDLVHAISFYRMAHRLWSVHLNSHGTKALTRVRCSHLNAQCTQVEA
jgi:hypothetical protein